MSDHKPPFAKLYAPQAETPPQRVSLDLSMNDAAWLLALVGASEDEIPGTSASFELRLRANRVRPAGCDGRIYSALVDAIGYDAEKIRDIL